MKKIQQIEGIGEVYQAKLNELGIISVEQFLDTCKTKKGRKELAQRNPENLTTAMEKVNEEKHLVRSVPYLKMVKKWVAQAKELPRVVEY